MECLNNKEWLVVYTKARGEKKLAKRLTAAGIEVYCPLIKVLKQWSDRKKKVEVPLFKSYLFVSVEASRRDSVIFDPLAVRYVYWLGKPAVIRENEMLILKKYVNDHSSIQVEGSSFQPGSELLIKDGPFKGEFGAVTELKDKQLRLFLPQLGCKLVAKLGSRKLVET